MGIGRHGGVMLAVVGWTTHAAAAQPLPPPVTQPLAPAVTLDWSAGVIIAHGVGLADRRAPVFDVARAAARSRGVAQARLRLGGALLELPWANGKSTAAQLSAGQLTMLVDAATVRTALPQTDGGWHIELQLPVEVVRQAAHGNRMLPRNGDDATVSVVALDARKLSLQPAVGLQVNDGGTTCDCATRWVTQWPGASTKVGSVNVGLLEISKPVGIKPTTLCVIIVSK